MSWEKISSEKQPIGFTPLFPKSNDSVMILVTYKANNELMYQESFLYGDFNDPFLVNVIDDGENRSMSYEKNMLKEDKLYVIPLSEKEKYGIIYRDSDNTIELYRWEN